VVQHGLAEVGLAAILAQSAVMQQPVPFAHVADGQAPAPVMGNGIAGTETHPGHRGGANRIVTGLATGKEQYDQQADVLRYHGAQSQLCLAVTHPALSGGKYCHASLLRYREKGAMVTDTWVCKNRWLALQPSRTGIIMNPSRPTHSTEAISRR